MADQRQLHGNVLGGMLSELFGAEMTGMRGCRAHGGTVRFREALLVFRDRPGDVVRCPAWMTIRMVSMSRPDGAHLHLAELRWLQALR